MGLLLLASAVPNLAFGGWGGVLADRKGAKNILIITQVMLALLAFSLGVLVKTGHIQFWHLMIFAFVEGTIISFDIPALNVVTPQLVPKEDFQQALALNSVNFHLSRVIGPSLAGLVMGLAGPSSVFWINGVSFFAVVWVVSKLPLKEHIPGPHVPSSKDAFRETWAYIKKNSLLSAILLQFVLVAALVFPLVFTAIRIHVQDTFHLSARDYGLVFSTPGIGALIGSVGFLLMTPKNPLRVLPLGLTGVVTSMIVMAHAQTLTGTIFSLAFFSISMFLTMSALLVTVQLMIEHHIRGRISALTGMAFASLSPIMAAPMGYLSDMVGARHLIEGIAIFFGLLSVLVGFRGGLLKREVSAT